MKRQKCYRRWDLWNYKKYKQLKKTLALQLKALNVLLIDVFTI